MQKLRQRLKNGCRLAGHGWVAQLSTSCHLIISSAVSDGADPACLDQHRSEAQSCVNRRPLEACPQVRVEHDQVDL